MKDKSVNAMQTTDQDIERFWRELLEVMSEMDSDVILERMLIEKNNGVEVDTIQVSAPCWERVSRLMELAGLFQDYKGNAKEAASFLHNIVSATGYDQLEKTIADFEVWQNVKSHICFRLVNQEKNAEKLSNEPWRPYIDLAVEYFVQVQDEEFGTGAMRVTNHLMETWGVTEEELWEAANINTPSRCPIKSCYMHEYLLELGFWFMPFNPMRILTNKENLYGSAALVYDGALLMLARECGGSFYVLPSSIHEVIILPENNFSGKREEEFLSMVEDINLFGVDPKEVLSDNVYFYDILTGELKGLREKKDQSFREEWGEILA